MSVVKESQLKPDPQSNSDSDPEIEIVVSETNPHPVITDILDPILDTLGKINEKK